MVPSSLPVRILGSDGWTTVEVRCDVVPAGQKYQLGVGSRLRRSIAPVIRDRGSWDFEHTGTAFFVTERKGWLSAYHVAIDEAAEMGLLSTWRHLLILEHGIVFGSETIPPERIAVVDEMFVLGEQRDDPIGALMGRRTERPIDAAVLGANIDGGPEPWSLSVCTTASPKVGEYVLAVGFATREKRYVEAAMQRGVWMEQLYACVGRVLHASDEMPGASLNPGPRFVVDGDWSGGFSGGPVFNMDGHVVGLVSRGLDAYGDSGAYGAGLDFAAWPEFEALRCSRTPPTIVLT